MSRHLGLIIGVNQYQDSTFQPLRFAENDARALAQWLVNKKGGNWSPPDVQLVQGQHATRELAESLITQIFLKKAEDGDVILFYFAGHAFVDERSGDGYLAFVNSQIHNTTTSLNIASFAQTVLARSRASAIICVVDSFQSGTLWDMRRTSSYDSKPLLGANTLQLLQRQKNRFFLCSCRGNSQCEEGGEKNLGYLTHRMIVGFSGAAVDPAKGGVLLPTLHSYLFTNLPEQQRPQLFGQQQGPVIVVGDLESTAKKANTATESPSPARPASSGPGSGMFKHPGIGRGAPDSPRATKTLSGQLTGDSPSSTMVASAKIPSVPLGTGDLRTPGPPVNQAVGFEAQIEQARAMLQAQQFAEAFDTVERILQQDPNEVQALILKSQLLGTAGRFVEALGVIDYLLQVDPNNAIGWSIKAVALNNTGEYAQAYTAIERSLELDASNPESYSIKNSIMEKMALSQQQTPATTTNALGRKKQAEQAAVATVPLWIDLAFHVLGLVLGVVGIVLTAVLKTLPAVGLLALSMGIALNCVTAVRGSFRSGITRVLPTVALTIIMVGILGAGYKVGYHQIVAQILLRPSLLLPILLAIVWLAIESIAPLLLAIFAFFSGLPGRIKRKKQMIEVSVPPQIGNNKAFQSRPLRG